MKRKSFIVFPRECKSKRQINPIDANKCLKPLSSINGTAKRGKSNVRLIGICIQVTRLWPVHSVSTVILMALIVCCSVKHKLSRQASPSRSTTSADRESNLPLAQRTDVDNNTKCQRSILKLKYSNTQRHILNKQSSDYCRRLVRFSKQIK